MANENVFIVNSKLLISKENQSFIESKGYRVEVIGELEDLVNVLQKKHPDLVIFEIISLTPEVVENIEELRKMPELHHVPYIAILNRATKNLVLFLAQMGIKEILVKPFTKDALLNIIDKTIAPIQSGNYRLIENKGTNGYTIVEFLKPVDASNSNHIDQLIKRLIDKGIHKIAFNLQRVTTIDSSGIGILMLCKKRLDIVSGSFKLGNLSSYLSNLLHELHIDKILDIVDDVISLPLDEKESQQSGEDEQKQTVNENKEVEQEVPATINESQ